MPNLIFPSSHNVLTIFSLARLLFLFPFPGTSDRVGLQGVKNHVQGVYVIKHEKQETEKLPLVSARMTCRTLKTGLWTISRATSVHHPYPCPNLLCHY